MSDVTKAPAGQFRVIGRDTRSDPGWRQDDYPTCQAAQEVAKQRNGINCVRFFVYNDSGSCVFAPELF